MKKLALIALFLSICFTLTGCIAPFRVKARAYATAEMTPPHVLALRRRPRGNEGMSGCRAVIARPARSPRVLTGYL